MRLILCLILSLVFVPAFAQDMALYKGSVPVADRSQAAREAAFPMALEQVLGKLSGLREVAAEPGVGEAIQGARGQVLSFHYDSLAAEAVAGSSSATTEAGVDGVTAQTLLVAEFSKAGIDRLVRASGLPRWPSSREPLEIWLLIDDGLGREIMPVEYTFLAPVLDRVAETRGLPIHWPQPDAEGDYGVDVQLLWGGYTETVEEDVEIRHSLVVAARREGPEWNVRFLLEYGTLQSSWRSRDINLETALAAALHQAVDEIATSQVIAPSDQGSWVHEISVVGVQSAEDYARCVAFLENLSVVDDLSVRSASPGQVSFYLTLNAAPEYLEQLIASSAPFKVDELTGEYQLQP